MFALFIDPASTNIGWAVFKIYPEGLRKALYGSGTIRPKGKNAIERIQDISRSLEASPFAFSRVPFELVVIEDTYQITPYNKKNKFVPESNARTVGILNRAIGAIIGHFPNVPIEMVKGHKTKEKAELIAKSYGVEGISDHACDAISMGHYWITKHWAELVAT